MLKAVVFDFDGVIVDSEPLHFEALIEVVRPLGFELSYEQYMQRFMAFDDRDCLRLVLEEVSNCGGADAFPEVEELVRRKGEAFLALMGRGIEPIPGALPLIEQLSARMPLAIASGACRHEIELITAALGIDSRFDAIFGADDVERSKPDPEVYSLAVRRLSRCHPKKEIEPRHCLAIEDTTGGIASAHQAGLLTLGVCTNLPREYLLRAHHVVDGLEQVTADRLVEWFDGLETA